MNSPFRSFVSLLSLSCLFTLSASAQDQQLPAAFAPVEVILEGLEDPAFLVIDADDVLYVSEEQAGRVLRVVVLPDGTVQAYTLLEGLKKPRGLAVDQGGPSTSPPRS